MNQFSTVLVEGSRLEPQILEKSIKTSIMPVHYSSIDSELRLKELPLMASMTSMAPSMAIDHVLMGLLMIF